MKIIASHNGLQATERTYSLLHAGELPLESLVQGISLVEDDPTEETVGYGGLPNENGVVELDAAIMDGLTHRAGAVAALQNIRHPTAVALLVMKQTSRVLLVGEGALSFARANGFTEENILTDNARRKWLHWRRSRSDIDDWLPPPAEDAPKSDTGKSRKKRKRLQESDFERPTGTVHVAALTSKGNMLCATSTSGHAFKLPGRVGDSPIVGAGLYVDNAVGTCGSIGWGEANMQNLSSYAVVEAMRTGLSPHEAGKHVLERIVDHTLENLLDADGKPTFNLRLFAMNKAGEHGGVCLFGPQQMAVTDENGTRLEDCIPLYRD